MKLTKPLNKPQSIIFPYLLDDSDFELFKENIVQNGDVQDFLGDKLMSKILEPNQSSADVKKLLLNHLTQTRNIKRFEYYRVYTVLRRLTINSSQFIPALYASYDLYAEGYYFMETVGVQYGLSFSNVYFDFFQWDKLNADEKRESLEKIFPSVQTEAKKIMTSLDKGKIKITGRKDREGLYTFSDNRSDFDRLSVFDIAPSKSKKSKWPILFKLLRRKMLSHN